MLLRVLAVGVTFYLIFVLPALTGMLIARSDITHRNPGDSRPAVVITVDRALMPSWKPTADSGSVVESPKVRLLGRNSEFITLWDPAEPDTSFELPVASIHSIIRP